MTHIEFLSSSTPAPGLPAQGGAEGSTTLVSGGDSKVIALLVGKAKSFVIPHKLGTQAYSVTIQKEGKGFAQEAKALSEGVSYYRLDSAASAADSIGANTGTLTGTIPTAAGALNPADTDLANEFTAASNFWKIAANASLEPFAAKFTFACFVFPTSTPGVGCMLSTSVGGVSNTAQSFLLVNRKPRLNLKPAGTLKTFESSTAVPLNEWSFVAGTADGANVKLYQATLGATAIKKELESAFAEESTKGTGIAIIGREAEATGGFGGRIDELYLNKAALTEAQLNKLFLSAQAVPSGPGEIWPSWEKAGEKITAVPLNINELEITFEKEPGAKENVWVTIEG